MKRNVGRALLELKRVLRPGGLLYLVEPNVGSDEFFDPAGRFGPMSMSLWYPEELAQHFVHTELKLHNYCERDESRSISFLLTK